MKKVTGSVIDRSHSKEIKRKMKARQLKKWCMVQIALYQKGEK
jgi:hypothetical protein